MLKKILLAITVISLAGAELSAQGLGLGVHGGYHRAGDADDGNVMFGAALRAKVSPALGLEGSISYRQETYADELVKVQNWPVMASLLFYPLPLVYGVAGLGWYNTTLDFNQQLLAVPVADRTSRDIGWHFGGGVELPAGSTRLFADIRYVFIDSDMCLLIMILRQYQEAATSRVTSMSSPPDSCSDCSLDWQE